MKTSAVDSENACQLLDLLHKPGLNFGSQENILTADNDWAQVELLNGVQNIADLV